MTDARLGIDALRGLAPFGFRRDMKNAQLGLSREQGMVDETINAEFKQAIHGVFELNTGLEISSQTRIEDLRSPLIKALGAGFDYFHALGKTNQIQEQKARMFLEAMSFVNRGEEKYASRFVEAVGAMAGYEMVEAKNDFDKGFTKTREKIERDGWQGLGVAVRGAVRQFLGYDTVSRLVDDFGDKLNHIVEVSEVLTEKAQVK